MPVKGLSGVPADIQLESLPDPANRFTLGSIIGTGVSGTVYEATDSQSNDAKVAIKIQKIIPDYENDIKEEYKILKYLANHPNLPTFLGAFQRNGEVWFALELCEGGSVIELVRGLYAQNRHLSEEQIAFVLKETVKGISHLHENHVVHRDVKAKNILLTADGQIKLVDFGLSRGLKNTLDRKSTCLGSPCWMAPELIVSGRSNADGVSSYDNRIDVWALGITALELAEGQAPYEEMHPTRAIFQVVRNPPPTFKLPSKWSQNYADFISECLVKLPEERPFIFEFLDHPFIKLIPDDSNIGQDLINLKTKVNNIKDAQKPEIHLRNGRLQRRIVEATEAMIVEDLAGIDDVTEDKIMLVLQERFNRGLYYTYIGDILVFVNPNTPIPTFGSKYHCKYHWKSRSDNSPHIYAVADVAYQDMLHHKQPQNIVISGETLSGKTTNYNHLIDHLLYLGKISNKISDKISAASSIIQTLGNAATLHNNNSTRHVINTQITFTTTGKLSGAIFYLYQLEKWRVTGYKTAGQGNFHIFYYFYDSIKAQGQLNNYLLQDTNYKYLVRKPSGENGISGGASNDPEKNAEKYTEILHLLEVLEFEPDQIEIVQKILAAIILLGEIRFQESGEEGSEVENVDIANNVASLLEVDEKKFLWALCNYCVIQKGNAIRKKQTVANAVEAQAVLVRGLYARLVDFIINVINLRLSVTRVVLGDKNFISVLDLPGFECFEQNNMEQLFINATNEQLQYFYNQRIFTWELKEQEEEGILLKPLQFYDNKPTIDELLSKPDGFMYVIDEASRSNSGHSFIIDALANCPRGTRIRKATSTNFTVAHYCKKVEYNAQGIPKKNHDFLPPEMIETLRLSGNFVVKQLFANQFTRSGNLTISTDQNLAIFSGKRKKWGAALVSGDSKSRKFNTEAQGEYSQTRRMRTCASVYRASSLELLKTLSEVENSSICFVRCIRAGLPSTPGFEADIVSPQLRSLSILDTTRARQIGYSYHVSFKDFIERYKFLAFDFEENVEITRENCRLLLIRLKMEGWIIGKNKVFLRYYDKEFLSRLYETHVKKIVKIQAVMRKFITKRKVIPRVQSQQSIGQGRGRGLVFKSKPTPSSPPEREISVVYSNVKIRGKPVYPEKVQRRKNQQPPQRTANKAVEIRRNQTLLVSHHSPRSEQKLAMKYFKKWKSKTVYQILLKYRSKMSQEFSDFSQQVHLYNIHANYLTTSYKRYEPVRIQNIDSNQTYKKFIGDPKPILFRIPFKLQHKSMYVSDLDFDPHASKSALFGEQDNWDTPFKLLKKEERLHCVTKHILNVKDEGTQVNFNSENIDDDADDSVYFFHYETGAIEKERKYVGRSLERYFSVCSIQSEPFERMEEVETDYSVPASSFGKVFMQLMCPSCCGGLFSETKGSVYYKRPPVRASKTKSLLSTVSDVVLEEDEENYENSEPNRPLSPIPEHQDKLSPPKSPNEMERKSRELRSVSLGDALCQELNQNKSDNGEINWNTKLRKTSLTLGESEQNKPKVDTVIELKIRGKEHVEVVKQNGDDDPPFNFQAILRKTSITRSSLPRTADKKSDNYFKTELLPGVILEGVIYDL